MKFNKEDKKAFKIVLGIFFVFFLIWFFVGVYAKYKTLPEGISVDGKTYYVSEDEIEFLYDLTYNKDGTIVYEQEIFDRIFELVDGAERFIVIDMFLFNTDYSDKVRFRNLTTEFKDKLVEKKKIKPEIEIVFTTDEINNFYGSYVSDELLELEIAGVEVVITDLTELRDINFLYAGFWRSYLQWINPQSEGWISHPLGNEDKKVTLSSFFRLLNVKANHRKVIVADFGNEIVSVVTSANPHEASSKHSNVAFLVKGDVGKDILDSEKGVSDFSGGNFPELNYEFVKREEKERDIEVKMVSEGKIKENILKDISELREGEGIDLGMFYLSDFEIVDALVDASERGVEVRVVLDPNKDAFAREKDGVPNRPVATELVKRSEGKVQVRWFNTQGEQYHSKILVLKKDGKVIVYLGSSNFTKRNLGDYNAELNLKATFPEGKKTYFEILDYFDRIWTNRDGNFTLEYSAYAEDNFIKNVQYKFQEFTGMSSF